MVVISDFLSEQFFYIFIQVIPMLPTKCQVKWPIGSEEEDGGHGYYLEFPIVKTFSCFDLQVTLVLPTKFQVNWHFSSGEKKRKTDFQNGGHLEFWIRII